MKLQKMVLLVCVLVFLLGGTASATPFFGLVDWVGDQGVELFEEDGTIGPGVGGQPFDVEYFAVKNTGSELFFALQTGFNVAGIVQNLRPGDIGIDISSDGSYEYAIDFSDIQTFDLIEVDAWTPVIYPQHSVAGPWVASGDVIGDDISTINLDVVNDSQGDHYVLFGSLSIDSFAQLASFPCVTMNWTMECGNDYGRATACPVVPEPATMTLIGMSVVGLLAKRKFC